MKIDPNQLVGGCVETVVTFTNPHTGEQTVKDKLVGGIPLRLEIAARLLPTYMVHTDPPEVTVRRALIWADALIAAHNATAEPKPRADGFTDIVFDGPPSHESGRFVEVEDHNGRSVNVGEWVESGDGYWRLRLRVSAEQLAASRDVDNATAGEVGRG